MTLEEELAHAKAKVQYFNKGLQYCYACAATYEAMAESWRIIGDKKKADEANEEAQGWIRASWDRRKLLANAKEDLNILQIADYYLAGE